MLNKKIVLSIALLLFSYAFTTTYTPAEVITPTSINVVAPVKATVEVTPLQVVANPGKYLHKAFVMDAKFDKFSTLGLDYKKAMRDSQNYIGFLVQRDDVKDHNVPLSELKFFVKRDYAEKFIDLNTGDKIKITGEVFSTALGDAWADIKNIEVVEKIKKEEKQ